MRMRNNVLTTAFIRERYGRLTQLIARLALVLVATNTLAKGNGSFLVELKSAVTVDGVTIAPGVAVIECRGEDYKYRCNMSSDWKASEEQPRAFSECPVRQIDLDEKMKMRILTGRLALPVAHDLGFEIPAGTIVERTSAEFPVHPWFVESLSQEVIVDGCHLARDSSVIDSTVFRSDVNQPIASGELTIQLASPCSVGGVPMAAGEVRLRPRPGNKFLSSRNSVVLSGVLQSESQLRFTGAIRWPAGTSFWMGEKEFSSTDDTEFFVCPSQPTPIKKGIVWAPDLHSCSTFDSAGRLKEAHFSPSATFHGVAFTQATFDSLGRPTEGTLTAKGAKIGTVSLAPNSRVTFFQNGTVRWGSLGKEYSQGVKAPPGAEVEFHSNGRLARVAMPYSKPGQREDTFTLRGWKVWAAEFDEKGILVEVELSNAVKHRIDGYSVEGICRFYPDGRLLSAYLSEAIRLGEYELLPGGVQFSEKGELEAFRTAVPFTTIHGRTHAAGEYVNLR